MESGIHSGDHTSLCAIVAVRVSMVPVRQYGYVYLARKLRQTLLHGTSMTDIIPCLAAADSGLTYVPTLVDLHVDVLCAFPMACLI
mmetsp:Transcript_53845/g.128258  ORF Transcript_53845/g.128258 Transcript_53845/m.128258 type:complete len:86 (+) Transcript_53845:38-295(+)